MPTKYSRLRCPFFFCQPDYWTPRSLDVTSMGRSRLYLTVMNQRNSYDLISRMYNLNFKRLCLEFIFKYLNAFLVEQDQLEPRLENCQIVITLESLSFEIIQSLLICDIITSNVILIIIYLHNDSAVMNLHHYKHPLICKS